MAMLTLRGLAHNHTFHRQQTPSPKPKSTLKKFRLRLAPDRKTKNLAINDSVVNQTATQGDDTYGKPVSVCVALYQAQ